MAKGHLPTSLALLLLSPFISHTVAAEDAPSPATTESTREILTSGDAWVRVAPNRKTVNLVLEETGASATQAEDKLSAKTAAITAALEKSFSARVFVRGGEIVAAQSGNAIGIVSGAAVKVSHYLGIDVGGNTDIGKVIDAALKAGATSVTDVEYAVRTPQAELDQATAEATKRAAQQAALLAKSLGVELGSVTSTTVGIDSEADLLAREKRQGTSGLFSDQEIKVTVATGYGIKGLSTPGK